MAYRYVILAPDWYYILYHRPLSIDGWWWLDTTLLNFSSASPSRAGKIAEQIHKQGYDVFVVKPDQEIKWNDHELATSTTFRLSITKCIVGTFTILDTDRELTEID